MDAIGQLPARWREATSGLEPGVVPRRPIPRMWSIAEYVDHVREVLFGMRFVLDSAVADPGIDLGAPPTPVFTPAARDIDLAAALAGVEREAVALRERLLTVAPELWTCTAVIGGDEVDARWICRHAVHDATHHLRDVERLLAVSGRSGRR